MTPPAVALVNVVPTTKLLKLIVLVHVGADVGLAEGLTLGVDVVGVEVEGDVLGLEVVGDSLGLTDGLDVGVSVGVDVVGLAEGLSLGVEVVGVEVEGDVLGLKVVGDSLGVEVVGVTVVGDVLGVDVVGLKVGLEVVGDGLGALVGNDVRHGPISSQACAHAPP